MASEDVDESFHEEHAREFSRGMFTPRTPVIIITTLVFNRSLMNVCAPMRDGALELNH